MISKALFVVACIAISTTLAQQPCLNAPQNPHSFAASPISCAHYTLCIGGNTVTGNDLVCPTGLFFDPPSQSCGQTSCFECSSFGLQNLPHPNNCYQFVECILGNSEIRTCPNGLLFDRTVGQCNTANVVICPGDPIIPTEDPYGTTTPPPWEIITTTPPPWEIITTTPPPWEIITTTPPPWGIITTTPSPQVPTCLGGQVFHASPSNCWQYFLCYQSVLWTFTCPNNLHWNQQINACDFAETAGCIHGGGGGGGGGGVVPPIDEPPLFPPNPIGN